MNEALQHATDHYRDRLTEIRIVDVPEWGDEVGPLKLYVKPANLATRDRIFKFAKADSLEALVQTVILRGRQENGLPVFMPSDAETMMTSVDPDVITRVATEINADLNDEAALEAEAAAGN